MYNCLSKRLLRYCLMSSEQYLRYIQDENKFSNKYFKTYFPPSRALLPISTTRGRNEQLCGVEPWEPSQVVSLNKSNVIDRKYFYSLVWYSPVVKSFLKLISWVVKYVYMVNIFPQIRIKLLLCTCFKHILDIRKHLPNRLWKHVKTVKFVLETGAQESFEGICWPCKRT